VSAAKVVATMLVPAIHQGNFLPPKKNSLKFLPAFLEKLKPTAMVTTKKIPNTSQSTQVSCIQCYLTHKYHFLA
jgi:hypothetical protein